MNLINVINKKNMKHFKYSNRPELPVFHYQSKTKDGFLISMTSVDKPEIGYTLETWGKLYTVDEVLEERISV